MEKEEAYCATARYIRSPPQVTRDAELTPDILGWVSVLFSFGGGGSGNVSSLQDSKAEPQMPPGGILRESQEVFLREDGPSGACRQKRDAGRGITRVVGLHLPASGTAASTASPELHGGRRCRWRGGVGEV